MKYTALYYVVIISLLMFFANKVFAEDNDSLAYQFISTKYVNTEAQIIQAANNCLYDNKLTKGEYKRVMSRPLWNMTLSSGDWCEEMKGWLK